MATDPSSSRSGTGARTRYDEYWSEGGFNPEQALMGTFEEVLARHVAPGGDYLDVGCGPGAGVGEWLAARGAYRGVDISRTAVATARERGLDAAVIEDASALPFEDAGFDVVVCSEVLEHLSEPMYAAVEIRRVLRPGGVLVATVPNVAHWRRRADLLVLGRWNPLGDDDSANRPWRDPHLRFFGLANLTAMLREAGFGIEEAGGHGVSQAMDLPLVRSLFGREPGPAGRALMRARPTLFAQRLHVVASR